VAESPRASGLPDRMAAAVGAGAGQPNKDDYQVKRIRRSSLASVLWLPSSPSGTGTLPCFELYVQDHPPFGTPYALYGTYFYTVQPKNPKHWRELAGIRVELAIPDTPGCRRPRPPSSCAPPCGTNSPSTRPDPVHRRHPRRRQPHRRWRQRRLPLPRRGDGLPGGPPGQERVGDELGFARLPQ
jgi:hypothetical protein